MHYNSVPPQAEKTKKGKAKLSKRVVQARGFIHVCIHINISLSIYIYIERERERERETMCML